MIPTLTIRRPRFRGDAGQRLRWWRPCSSGPAMANVMAYFAILRKDLNAIVGTVLGHRVTDCSSSLLTSTSLDMLTAYINPQIPGSGGGRPMRRSSTRAPGTSSSRSRLSVFGLLTILAIALATIVAPLIAPYPEHVGIFVDFRNTEQPPVTDALASSAPTSSIGRDIFSRRSRIALPSHRSRSGFWFSRSRFRSQIVTRTLTRRATTAAAGRHHHHAHDGRVQLALQAPRPRHGHHGLSQAARLLQHHDRNFRHGGGRGTPG